MYTKHYLIAKKYFVLTWYTIIIGQNKLQLVIFIFIQIGTLLESRHLAKDVEEEVNLAFMLECRTIEHGLKT